MTEAFHHKVIFHGALLSHSYSDEAKKNAKNCAVSYGICVTKTVIKEFSLCDHFLHTFCKRHGHTKKKFPYFGAFCSDKTSSVHPIAIEPIFGSFTSIVI